MPGSRPCPGGRYLPSSTRDTGHGRIETRTLKTAHVNRLDFPHARQAIKITRRREDTSTGKTSRETLYAITSLTSAHATAPDLARLVREHWSVEAHHHVRDVTFGEDKATNRTRNGPANLATIRAAIIAAIKDAGYLHVPEGRRDHTTPAETLHLHGLD
jgi:predicted transposase YbfD/YdcC